MAVTFVPAASDHMGPDDWFRLDVARSLLLSKYIDAWGLPQARKAISKDAEKTVIEVYYFPPGQQNVARFATVGLCEATRILRKGSHYEFLLALPDDLGNATQEAVFDYLLSIAVYSLKPEVQLRYGYAVGPSPLAPPSWDARGLLFDEPRGEVEELTKTRIADHDVHLLWAIPVHANEFDLVRARDVGALDSLARVSNESIIDPLRASFVRVR